MRALLHLAVSCLVTLCSATLAQADCASSGTDFWPPIDQPLAPSGLLYVEGYGVDQPMVTGLVEAQLESKGARIKLVPIVTHVGALLLTQTVFRAERPLTPGVTYTLVLTGARTPKSDTTTWRPTRYTKRGTVPVQWTVAPAPAVTWTGAPRLGKPSFAAFGCGPAIHQQVVLPLSAPAGLVEVSITGAGAPQRYAVPIGADASVQLGHGMCSGAFNVGGKGAYTAQFALLTGAGARVPAASTVTFDAVQPQ